MNELKSNSKLNETANTQCIHQVRDTYVMLGSLRRSICAKRVIINLIIVKRATPTI